jgi:teichoic acid transport system permease protein
MTGILLQMADVLVFEPFRRGMPPLRDYARDMWRRRSFVSEYAHAALKGQHADTNLGRLWLVVNPLFLALVYYVLILVIGLRGEPSADFFLHLVAGVFAFYFFSTALTTGATSISSAGGLVLRHRMPRLVLPLATTLAALRRFAPAVVLLVIGTVLFRGWPGPSILYALPSFLLLLTLAFGAVLMAATAQVYVRDVGALVPMISRIALYLSPVLYTPDQVPDKLLALLQLNPLFWIMASWTSAFSGEEPIPASGWLIATIWAVAALFGGLLVFLSRERDFASHV